MTTREKLTREIKTLLKEIGATPGETCAELSRIERCNLVGVKYFLHQLKQEAEKELVALPEVFDDIEQGETFAYYDGFSAAVDRVIDFIKEI